MSFREWFLVCFRGRVCWAMEPTDRPLRDISAVGQARCGIRFHGDGDEGVSIKWDGDLDAPATTEEADHRADTKDRDRSNGSNHNITYVASRIGSISVSDDDGDAGAGRDNKGNAATADVVSSVGGQDQRECSQP